MGSLEKRAQTCPSCVVKQCYTSVLKVRISLLRSTIAMCIIWRKHAMLLIIGGGGGERFQTRDKIFSGYAVKQ